jgi:hypothetical protein
MNNLLIALLNIPNTVTTLDLSNVPNENTILDLSNVPYTVTTLYYDNSNTIEILDKYEKERITKQRIKAIFLLNNHNIFIPNEIIKEIVMHIKYGQKN